MRHSLWLSILVAGLAAGLTAACHSDVALGGPNTLVRVEHEPIGPNCPTGGVSIHTGLDDDGDTFLDDGEITSTQLVCNGSTTVQCAGGNVLTGTIAVRVAADWAQLDGVNCIAGELLIAGIASATIPARPDLQIVTGDVVIAGNTELTTLAGLSGLREIGGTFLVQGNDALVDIAAIGGVKRVGGIQLIGNDALIDLAGLSTLTDIDASLSISNNAGLSSLAGLDNLRTTTRTISIRANQALTSLDALANLRQAQLIEISGNEVLASVALPSLKKVDVRLQITANAKLTEVSLPALSTIGDFIRFDGNPALRRVEMPVLLTLGGLQVSNANLLEVVSAPSLVFATATVQLVNLPRLNTLELDSLTSIGDQLVLNSLADLPTLAGLARLQSIGGAFSVLSTGSLRDFTGLGALEGVSGAMAVSNNPQLRSFAGLAKLREVGGDLTITNNPVLPLTTAQTFGQSITVRGKRMIN